MVILGAPSLNALDFLALLSGATFEEAEADLRENQEIERIACLKIIQPIAPLSPTLFLRNDERYFLEILYLKFSFLEELIQTVFSWKDLLLSSCPKLALHRIWVQLRDSNHLLPFFWNFRMVALDLCGNSFERQSGSGLHRSMACIPCG